MHTKPLYFSTEQFNAMLHHTLLCTNELAYGSRLRKKETALKHKYIQFNDLFIKFLVLDIDRPGSAYDWDYAHLPAPNLVVINPENTHCHYIYALETPICRTDNAKLKPLAYFAKIQQAYTEKLNADSAFVGLLTKNPNDLKNWTVAHFGISPYSLEFLAEHVELKPIQKRTAIGEGRNCFLFESLRKIAYREVLFYKQNGATYDSFYAFLLAKVDKLNIFPHSPSLTFNEIKGIAKSVAKWTWRNFNLSTFSEIQRARSAKELKIRNYKKTLRQNQIVDLLRD